MVATAIPAMLHRAAAARSASKHALSVARRHISVPASHPRMHEFLELEPHASLPSPSALNIIPDFLSEREHDLLEAAVTAKLRRLFGRRPYQEAHSDHVITGYKEAMVSAWSTGVARAAPEDAAVVEIIDRIKETTEAWIAALEAETSTSLNGPQQQLPKRPIAWMPPHLLDMRSGNSGIGAHVDYVDAAGAAIAGVCLVSPSVIIFRNTNDPQRDHFKLLAPPRCLYMQTGNIRYNYTHEIPMTEDSTHSFRGQFIERGRRISVMVRDKLILRAGATAEPAPSSMYSRGASPTT